MNNNISVVIPCRNEEKGIAAVVKQALKVASEVIVVDNNSTDNTAKVAAKAGAKVLSEKRTLGGIGYGYAHIKGLKAATGDFIVTIDGDGTYPIEKAPEIVAKMETENLDFVSTNRFPLLRKNAISKIRQLGIAILNLEVALLYGKLSHDILSGMWVVRKSAAPRLNLTRGDWNLSPEIKISAMTNHYLKCAEFYIDHDCRIGESKQAIWKTGFSHATYIVARKAKEVNMLLKELSPKLNIAKAAVTTVGVILLALGGIRPALAADYGGGTTPIKGLEFNKQVQNPINGNWQGSIKASEHSFAVGDEVKFKILFRNTGNTDLEKMMIVDRLPAELTWTRGDGVFHKEDNTIDFDLGTLKADSGWKSVEFTAKVVKASGIEVTNLAILKENGEERARATSSIHLRGGVLGLPATGPTETIMLTVISALLSAVGIALRRKS